MLKHNETEAFEKIMFVSGTCKENMDLPPIYKITSLRLKERNKNKKAPESNNIFRPLNNCYLKHMNSLWRGIIWHNNF